MTTHAVNCSLWHSAQIQAKKTINSCANKKVISFYWSGCPCLEE